MGLCAYLLLCSLPTISPHQQGILTGPVTGVMTCAAKDATKTQVLEFVPADTLFLRGRRWFHKFKVVKYSPGETFEWGTVTIEAPEAGEPGARCQVEIPEAEFRQSTRLE